MESLVSLWKCRQWSRLANHCLSMSVATLLGIAGWSFKGFLSTTVARRVFGLVVADGQLYPNGKPFYTADVFPLPVCYFHEDMAWVSDEDF